MRKLQTILRYIMAAAILLGIQTPANALFGNLVKKAKKAAGVENTNSSSSTSNSPSTESSSTSNLKTLNDLDAELFIYQNTGDNPFATSMTPITKRTSFRWQCCCNANSRICFYRNSRTSLSKSQG